MKKLLLSLIAASVFVTGCGTTDSNTTASTDNPTNTASPTAQTTAANSDNVNITLVSPQGTVPMGDAGLIVELKDGAGQPVVTDNLMVDVSMPMEGEETMQTETEVSPGSEPGLYQINTYLSMQGTWIIKVAVNEAQQQGQADFTIEAQ